MFISWSTSSASASCYGMRIVCCEACKAEYIFEVEFHAYAESTNFYGIGADKAHEYIQDSLEEQLDWKMNHRAVCVPCPACGYYQSDMIEEIREQKHPLSDSGVTLLKIGSIGAIGSALLVAILGWGLPTWPEDWQILSAIVLLLASMYCRFAIWLRRRRNKRKQEEYDPNERVPLDRRLTRAWKRAGLLSEYENEYGPLERPKPRKGRRPPAFVTIPLGEPFGEWPPRMARTED